MINKDYSNVRTLNTLNFTGHLLDLPFVGDGFETASVDIITYEAYKISLHCSVAISITIKFSGVNHNSFVSDVIDIPANTYVYRYLPTRGEKMRITIDKAGSGATATSDFTCRIYGVINNGGVLYKNVLVHNYS
tara:strand:+ start:454 stop:855 length:402 start_codon:yes stop_codon:yes gene_type:complete